MPRKSGTSKSKHSSSRTPQRSSAHKCGESPMDVSAQRTDDADGEDDSESEADGDASGERSG